MILVRQNVGQRQPMELGAFDAYLRDDWDGEGAEAVSERTLGLARAIVTEMPRSLPRGSAMAGIDGSVGLYWSTTDASLYLDVRPDGRIRYVYFGRGLDRAGDVLPADASPRDVTRAVWAALETMQGSCSPSYVIQYIETAQSKYSVPEQIVGTTSAVAQQAIIQPVVSMAGRIAA